MTTSLQLPFTSNPLSCYFYICILVFLLYKSEDHQFWSLEIQVVSNSFFFQPIARYREPYYIEVELKDNSLKVSCQ